MMAAEYRIVVRGQLDQHWRDWFLPMTIAHDEQGNTVLSGPLPDQAALHGLLVRIRDLGLVLLSLQRLEHEDGKELRRL